MPEPTTRDQTGRQRAIQAVRAVLADHKPHDYREHHMTDDETTIVLGDLDDLAAELVDAVQGAGHDDHDRFAGQALQDPDVRAGYRRDAEARGYQQAVDNLRDEQAYEQYWRARPNQGITIWRSDILRGLADYLEAVGPGGTGKGGEEAQPLDPTSEAVAAVLLNVQQKLAAIHYHWSGGLPFVGREAIFQATNDVAREALGEDWYQVLGEVLDRRSAKTGQHGQG